MRVGVACPAFCCDQDGGLTSFCHRGGFCVVARQKQLQLFGNILKGRFEVTQIGHIGCSPGVAKQLKT